MPFDLSETESKFKTSLPLCQNKFEIQDLP